jgi:hypothetical protein
MEQEKIHDAINPRHLLSNFAHIFLIYLYHVIFARCKGNIASKIFQIVAATHYSPIEPLILKGKREGGGGSRRPVVPVGERPFTALITSKGGWVVEERVPWETEA